VSSNTGSLFASTVALLLQELAVDDRVLVGLLMIS
jgi:hypothetical protein